MTELGSRQLKCLTRIRDATDKPLGTYPGEPVDMVSRKVANRLQSLGYIEQFEPHNPVHKVRWVITGEGRMALPPDESDAVTDENAFDKMWDGECEVCGQSPTVRATGLCGPCTWGEADTIGGNW